MHGCMEPMRSRLPSLAISPAPFLYFTPAEQKPFGIESCVISFWLGPAGSSHSFDTCRASQSTSGGHFVYVQAQCSLDQCPRQIPRSAPTGLRHAAYIGRGSATERNCTSFSAQCSVAHAAYNQSHVGWVGMSLMTRYSHPSLPRRCSASLFTARAATSGRKLHAAACSHLLAQPVLVGLVSSFAPCVEPPEPRSLQAPMSALR